MSVRIAIYFSWKVNSIKRTWKTELHALLKYFLSSFRIDYWITKKDFLGESSYGNNEADMAANI